MSTPLYSRERDLVPIVQEGGWAMMSVCTGAETFRPPQLFETRTVHPSVSHTDYMLPAITTTTTSSFSSTTITTTTSSGGGGGSSTNFYLVLLNNLKAKRIRHKNIEK